MGKMLVEKEKDLLGLTKVVILSATKNLQARNHTIDLTILFRHFAFKDSSLRSE